MNTPQRKPLTVKEIKLVKGIAEGKTKQAAALAAYDASTPEIASSIASNTLKKVNVQEALAEALAQHGITLDAAIAPISTALKGKRTILVDGTPMEIDDVDLQLKGSDRALKLMGIGQQTGNVTVNYIGYAQNQREIYDL